MNRTSRWAAPLAMALLLAGCYYYGPAVPVTVQGPSAEQRYDRAWNAASGAMADQGVTITSQDRGAGIIRGTRGAIAVQGSVRTLADGRIEVKFNTSGDTNADPGLIHRVSESYDRRMGN